MRTAIEAAEAILADADNYESVDALKAAADAGKAVLAKADATQAEIEQQQTQFWLKCPNWQKTQTELP